MSTTPPAVVWTKGMIDLLSANPKHPRTLPKRNFVQFTKAELTALLAGLNLPGVKTRQKRNILHRPWIVAGMKAHGLSG